MLLSALFWNVGDANGLEEVLVALCSEHSINLMTLAEAGHISRIRLIDRARDEGIRLEERKTGCPRIRQFCAPDSVECRPIRSNAYAAFYEIGTATGPHILLGGTHLPSKLHTTSDDQREVARLNLIDPIRRLEEKLGHDRTVLVGDFNMDPFEPGIVAAGGLHATFSQTIAMKGSRMVFGERYQFFYNPMWRHYAAISERPGTFYRSDSSSIAYFWHMYDQVLIRPSLISALLPGDPLIVDRAQDHRLLTRNGLPNRREYSDHLPLLFRFDIATLPGA